MSFLAPIFLWLLPLTAIPLIIHLLNRRNLITIDFSSLRFIKLLERDSIRKLKLLQLILLIIRTIIILLIILMITRPIIKNKFNSQISGESKLHAIILDDSFSIRGREGMLRNVLNNILEEIPNKDRIIWINLNNGLQFNGIKEDLPIIDNFTNMTYHSGSFSSALHVLNENTIAEIASYELYILTDAQKETISSIKENTLYLDLLNTYILIIPPLKLNLSITQLKIQNEILIPNESINIEVMVQNNGIKPIQNTLLQLVINEIIVGQQLISLQPKTEKIFIFKTILPKSGLHLGKIEIENDERNDDNNFYFTLNIPEKLNVALISDSKDGIYYLEESLNVLNKLGESLTFSHHVSINNNDVKLFEKHVIIIFNMNDLNTISNSLIEEYIYKGGHIILFPNSESNTSIYSSLHNIFDLSHKYNNLEFHSLADNSFQDIDIATINNIDIYEIFTETEKQDRNIRFFKYISLPYSAEATQIQLNDGNSIWNRYKMQSGILDIFGYALNLNWTNFPIKGSFLPFNHYLIYSHIANTKNLYNRSGDKIMFTPKEYYMNTIYHILPNGSKNILIPNQNNILSISSLNNPGFHTMQTDNYTFHTTAVNITQDELVNDIINFNYIKDALSENFNVIQMNEDMLTEIKKIQDDIELWRYCLYAAIIMLLLEMILSNAKKEN
jgi:hypothetical protein